MEKCKKVIAFFILFAFVIGFVDGVGYAFYIHEYKIAVCGIITGLVAIGAVRTIFKYLSNS